MFNCSSTEERQQCSNKGFYCDDIFRQACICDEGYWSSSTHANNADLGCDINILVEFILDYLCVFLCFLSILITLRFFIVNSSMENVSFFTFISKKESKTLFPLMFCVGTIFDLATAIENIRYGEMATGNTPSILFGPFFVFFFQFGFILYFFVVLKFLRSCNGYISLKLIMEISRFNKMINRLASLAYCVPSASFCLCAMSLIGLEVPKYQNGLIKIYIAGSGLLALIFGLLITYSFRYVLLYLEEHIGKFDQNQTSTEIQAVYIRLKRAYYVCGSMSLLIGIFGASFGSSSYLWDKSHYIFTVIRIILPPLCTLLMIAPSKKNSRDSIDTNIQNGQVIASASNLISATKDVTVSIELNPQPDMNISQFQSWRIVPMG